jgi:hypothetical protein
MARQPRSFALKKKTSHAGEEKPPNPILRPHTRARKPCEWAGPQRVLWETQGKRGDFSPLWPA